METQFEIRPFCAKDIAPMARIIGKIGLCEFKDVISIDSITGMMGDTDDAKSKVDLVGYGIVIDLASIVCSNLDKAEKDIFSLLADLSGMTAKKVAELPLADFAELAIAVFKAEDFKDFFTRVKALLK
ncbi:MAG: hypothetical protein RR178_05235 [Gordonibacter sp.]